MKDGELIIWIRYSLDMDFKVAADLEKLKDPAEKSEAKKAIRKLMEERYEFISEAIAFTNR